MVTLDDLMSSDAVRTGLFKVSAHKDDGFFAHLPGVDLEAARRLHRIGNNEFGEGGCAGDLQRAPRVGFVHNRYGVGQLGPGGAGETERQHRQKSYYELPESHEDLPATQNGDTFSDCVP